MHASRLQGSPVKFVPGSAPPKILTPRQMSAYKGQAIGPSAPDEAGSGYRHAKYLSAVSVLVSPRAWGWSS